ncbi:MAG: tRNA (guanosine(37)-N1)-methyltransferase TrmD [Simkaniaceae bacterium]|nr:tRNA (guanosine(37)-N1)-methyltransferase TrmD [Simkaniaceae bacterium]MCF7852956.1 tRNA (guanosine(37)-N1)-methyltransferase TrmD [Simkaniaceae bacterium]
MKFDILSLFPDYFTGPFDVSILKRAKKNGLIDINLVNIRNFAHDKHQTVDDRPYGGGPGMVLKPEPLTEAIRSVRSEKSHVCLLSPQGKLLTAAKCRRLAQLPHLVLVCGHYEAVDERVIESEIDEEISIGDYVLTSGAPAAIVLIDAISRFIPGVIGNEEAANQDSFEQEMLFDAPHYTRPEEFEGKRVPEVLLNGHHKEIEKWRRNKALLKTQQVRPDLLDQSNLYKE